jgi:hypothetical protein
MAEPRVTLADLGQSYRPLPPASFEERFGQWPGMLDQETLRQLLTPGRQPGEIVPGEQFVDPYGHRGLRDLGTGYYLLRRI